MIKSVVVERSTHDERRATHQRLAELFADQPERRGHHLAEAADAPDEEIATAIEEAAHRTLERGDVVGAISRLLRAADLSPNRTDRSRRLADTAYIGARLAGDLDRRFGAAARRASQGSNARRDAPRGGRHRLSPPQQRRQRRHGSSPPARCHRRRLGRARSGWRRPLGRPLHVGAGVPLRRTSGVLGLLPRRHEPTPARRRASSATPRRHLCRPAHGAGSGAVRAGPRDPTAALHRRRRGHHAVRDRRVLHRPLDGVP